MLFMIKTRNPFNYDMESFVVGAASEDEAKIKFSMDNPSYKVGDIFRIEGDVLMVRTE